MIEYGDPLAPAQPESYYFNLLRELEQTDVVCWDRSLQTYRVSAAARRLLNSRRWVEFHGQACRVLHQCAITMYWQQALTEPASCEAAIVELWFHLAMVFHRERQPAELRRQALLTLDFARHHLSQSRLFALREQLARDHELGYFLPSALRRELLNHLHQNNPRSKPSIAPLYAH
jgi:hypothetical protein